MKKPFLWDTVNYLYHGAMNNMPSTIQERSMANAFILGYVGMYGVVRSIQYISRNFADYFIPDFDEKYLSILDIYHKNEQ